MTQIVVMLPADLKIGDQVPASDPPPSMGMVDGIYSVGEKRAWVAVAVAPNCEAKAVRTLARDHKANSFVATQTEYVAHVETRLVKTKRGRERWQQKTTRKPVIRKRFPGYIFTEVPTDGASIVCDGVEYAIGEDESVRYILGGERGPIPIREDEIVALQQGDPCPRLEALLSFKVGEGVLIADGPFASFPGTVEEIDEDKQRLKVAVSIFGRATPVDLAFDQVQKVV